MELKNGMIIECNSEQEAQEFIKEAYKQGFKWVNHIDGNEERTCWGYTCDFNSKIYYYLEKNKIQWDTICDSNNSIDYSKLKEKNKTMTKSDLQNGMVVELRNKDRFLVHNGMIINEIGYLEIDSDGYYNDFMFNENLTCKTKNESYDIVRIYKSKALSIAFIFDNEYLELIWEREEEKNKKDEIKVGDNVKVINNNYILETLYKWVENNINNNFDKYSFDYGHKIPDDSKCTVIHIGEFGGLIGDMQLAYIKDINTKRCYVIRLEGIKKID